MNETRDSDIIHSDAEEEDINDWQNVHDPLQKEAKEIITKKVKSIRLNAKRTAAKKIAEARFLKRRRSK